MMGTIHAKIGLGALMALGFALMPLSAQIATYNFDNLSTGALSGSATPSDSSNQDGWYLDSAITSQVVQIGTGTGINTSKIATVSGINSGGRAIRNFGTNFYTGTETAAVFQFDYLMGGNSSAVQMSLGGNGTSATINGNSQGAFGPRVMVTAGTNSLTFGLVPKQAGGNWSSTSVSQTISGTTGDWYQIQLVMNFTTNGGDGSGTLLYRDLTAGDTSFTTLASISNVDLLLSDVSSGYTAANWNQVWMRISEGATAGTTGIDNIVMAVPEPSAMAMMLTGLVFWCVYRLKRTWTDAIV